MNVFHLANNSAVYRIEYPVTNMAWIAPTNHKNIYIFAVAGGAGGGAGYGGPENTQRGGGAGGTRGAFTGLLLPNRFGNRPFYITVGAGGAGGLGGVGTGGNGTDGGNTIVTCDVPHRGFATPCVLLELQGGRANSTAAGTSTSGGIASSWGWGNPSTSWWTIWHNPSNSTLLTNGLGGGATGAGNNSISDTPASHGAGGAGCANGSFTAASGGSVSSGTDPEGAGVPISVFGGSGSAVGNGSNGNSGIYQWHEDTQLLYTQGGAGGGNSNTGTGGNGGNGALASGGGGGGGGLTGGNGGAGGNGFVIILTW